MSRTRTSDVFTKKKRSAVMSMIRGKGNKETELRLMAILRQGKVTGWRRHLALPGRPDFAFRRQKVAVFVDGCFWHGCPEHGRNPNQNQSYWIPKLARNQERDREVSKSLRARQWRVLRFWEHELNRSEKVLNRILKALNNREAILRKETPKP